MDNICKNSPVLERAIISHFKMDDLLVLLGQIALAELFISVVFGADPSELVVFIFV